MPRLTIYHAAKYSDREEWVVMNDQGVRERVVLDDAFIAKSKSLDLVKNLMDRIAQAVNNVQDFTEDSPHA